MDKDEREALAADRAEQYAPMPTGGSFMAGICGAVVALLGDRVVSGFYGWRVRENVLIAAATTMAGFLIGFLAHRRLARAHRKAWNAELAEINHDQDGPRR